MAEKTIREQLNARPTISIWFSDIEKTAKQLYPELKDWRILDEYQELYNDSYVNITVDGKYGTLSDVGDDEILIHWMQTGELRADIDDLSLSAEDMEILSGAWWDSQLNIQLRHVMHRLELEGYLDKGEYCVELYW